MEGACVGVGHARLWEPYDEITIGHQLRIGTGADTNPEPTCP